MRPSDLTPVEVLAERHPHGTRVRYMTGCRCVPCRAANSRYESARAVARKNGDWNGIVAADMARAHVIKLSRLGIGRGVISEASGVSRSVIADIRARRKTQIRMRTQRAILSVTAEARGEATLLKAAPVWAQINWLLRAGFTRGGLAQRLGRKMASLQIQPHVVTARTAMRVAKLYAEVSAGDPELSHRARRYESYPQRSQRRSLFDAC